MNKTRKVALKKQKKNKARLKAKAKAAGTTA